MIGIQLNPFSAIDDGFRSGPTIVVDERTIFISNLHYNGSDVQFRVGKGNVPDSKGTIVSFSNYGQNSLPPFDGDNIYVTLPENMTVSDVDYLSLWDIEIGQSVGHVSLKDVSQNLPKAKKQLDVTVSTCKFEFVCEL